MIQKNRRGHKQSRMGISVIPATVLSLLAIGICIAADSPTPLDLAELAAPAFTAFTASSGLPETVIWDIDVDRKGFVWISSPAGLFRYDGHRWEPQPSPVDGGLVRSLFRDHVGTFWAGRDDAGLARYDGENWRLEGPESGLPTAPILHVTQTPGRDGLPETWALSTAGDMLRRRGDRWEHDSGSEDLPSTTLHAVVRTRELAGGDRLWLATGTHGLWYRDEGGSWRRDPRLDAGQIDDLVVTRHRNREELWIATFGRGLWRLTRDGFTSWTVESGDLPSNMLYDLRSTELPNGEPVIWVCSRNGLLRVQRDQVQVYDRRHGLPSNGLRALGLWRSPSGVDVLWLATEAGVARTISGANPWYTASLLGASSIGVFGVRLEPDGRGGERLWVAASQDGIGLFENGSWRLFNPDNGRLPGPNTRFVVRVPDERGREVLWAEAGGHLLRIVEHERGSDDVRFTEVPTPWSKPEGESVLDLVTFRRDDRYELWVGNRLSGLYVWSDGRWRAPPRPGGVTGQWRVFKFVEQTDRSGRAWLWASTDKGLLRYDGTEWTLLGSEAGLTNVQLVGLSMLPDAAGNPILWAGSTNGVVRIDVSDPLHTRALASSDLPAPPDPFVYCALRDSRGRIYISTNNGVQQLTPDGAGGYRERVFTRRDGMVHDECNTNAQMIDAHDRYWVGTLAGLSVYDPNVKPDTKSKLLVLTHVRIDGAEVPAEGLRVPPEARELRVDFALLSWQRESESRFRTELVGYDAGPGPWVAQNYRVFGVLPPGEYVLKIEARDYADLASEPIELRLEVVPVWWQRTWFRMAVAAVFLIIGPLAYFVRVRQLSQQKAHLESVVASRTAELAAANDRLAQLSLVDALTGIANRRRLDEVLDLEWRRAIRLKTPLSLLMIDVDHFKAYNDRLGHPAGDRCLKAVADALAAMQTRAGDTVARYGGEEFAVLVPGATHEQAMRAAERVREGVADLQLPHPDSSAGAVVTVSVGVASVLPTDGSVPAELVGAADSALYAAKREGRNCVRTSPFAQRPSP